MLEIKLSRLTEFRSYFQVIVDLYQGDQGNFWKNICFVTCSRDSMNIERSIM